MIKKLLSLITLIWMVGLACATSYGLGDSAYGLTYHYTQGDNVLPTGGYTAYMPSYVKVIDDGVLYSMNVSGNNYLFCAYNFTANTTLWCADVGTYDGISAYFPYIEKFLDYMVVAGTNRDVIDTTGTITNNDTSPQYYNWINIGTPYANRYYNNNTRMGFSFDSTQRDNYDQYWMSVRLKYYNSSGEQVLQPYNSMGREKNMRGYESKNANPHIVLGMNYPIYDKTNNYIIQVAKEGYDGAVGNTTYVLKYPEIIPPKFNLGCFNDVVCGANGSGYYVDCSVDAIVNTTPSSCTADGQCAAPTPYCRNITAEGTTKCVSTSTAGVCQMGLKDQCIITTPSSSPQRAYTYDYTTKILYLYVLDGSNLKIYSQDVGQCTFDGSNRTATLFGTYGTAVSAGGSTDYISQSPIMDNNFIYIVWNNATGYYFQKISRSDKTVVYSKQLTKDLYDGSLSGGITGLSDGYLGYDTTTHDVYVFVYADKYIRFGEINYTICPSGEAKTADPMCYTNGTLDLIDHQFCDLSFSPINSRPCVDKLYGGESFWCNRDWQCINGGTQGWCNVDVNSSCKETDSPLSYNCSTGMLSWNQASEDDAGFWFYEVTSGNTSSLFDTSSAEQISAINIFDLVNTSISIVLDPNLYYRVIAIDNDLLRYWKTDIIPGTSGTTSTTTTTSTTGTTASTSTTTSTSTTLTGSNYTLTVTADKSSYTLNETLTAEAFKAYFKFRGTPVQGGTCIFSVDDSVFRHADIFDFGKMIYTFWYNNSYYVKNNWVQVRDNITAQNTWINVTCSNGAFNIMNATNVSIIGFQVGANPILEVVNPLGNGAIGDDKYVTVRFRLGNGTLIQNATCRLYVNDIASNILDELTNHLYETSYHYYFTGYYTYEVRCSSELYDEYSVFGEFNVTTFGTTTTLHPGAATTLPAGATTTTTLFPPACGRTSSGSYVSLCHCSDVLSLEGCRNDGSEHCNGTYCIPDQCIPGSSCEIDGYCCGLMLWNENQTGTYVRERECNGEHCTFQSSSGYSNSTTAMRIYPLTGITYYDGLNYIYLAVCEDNTNGVRITTGSIATTTSYQLLTSAKTPAISQMYTPKPFSTTKADKTALIPELCSWAGTGGKYALVHFESVYQGGNPSFENKYIRIEKEGFKVNITHSDPIQLTLSRNGTCFATPSKLNPYTQIGNNTGITFTFNRGDYANNSGMIYVFCNSTYGEPYSLTEGGGGAWFLKALFLLILNFIITLALNLLGIENFQWQNWYTPLVVIILVIPFPLLYLIYRDIKRRRKG